MGCNGTCNNVSGLNLGMQFGPPLPFGVQPLFAPGCNGVLQPGCQTVSYAGNVAIVAAGATFELEVAGYQALQLVGAIYDGVFAIGPGDVTLQSIQYHGTSTEPKFTGANRVSWVADVFRWTNDSARSGTLPFPPNTPLADQTNMLKLQFQNNTAVPIPLNEFVIECRWRAPMLMECLVADQSESSMQTALKAATDHSTKFQARCLACAGTPTP